MMNEYIYMYVYIYIYIVCVLPYIYLSDDSLAAPETCWRQINVNTRIHKN